MEFFNKIEDLWQDLCEKTEPGRKKCGQSLKKTGGVLKVIGSFIYKYKGIILAAPVLICAIILAFVNMTKLPASVGINLLANGEFSMMVARWLAVLVPLLVTGFCALLTLSARKPLYPWLISLFSLVLPLLIYVTNVYPA